MNLKNTQKKDNMKNLSNEEVSSFCAQMSMILKAGISSMEGIQIMMDDAKSEEEQQILEEMYLVLMTTGSLYEAIHSLDIFPTYMTRMVELGEYSGHLDDVMEELAAYYERENALASTIRNAVTYPMVMAGMMMIVILLLITKILPVFYDVFEQLGQEVNGISGFLMKTGYLFNHYSMVLVIILGISLIVFIIYIKTKRSGKVFQLLASKIGFTRKIQEKTNACRFAGGMALTLSSGLPIEECVHMAAGLVDQEDFKKKIEKMTKYMSEEGEDINNSLVKSGIFHGLSGRMLKMASKTGHIDEAMQDIAKRYQDEIDQDISSFINILEPSLLVVLSLITGIILLSVIFPVMGIMTGL